MHAYREKVSVNRFNSSILRQFLILINAQILTIDNLDIPTFLGSDDSSAPSYPNFDLSA